MSPLEKERFLRALEEDRSFRYAVMGLLGFKEILDRITRIEERITKLEERFTQLEERQQRLEERQQRLEERQQRLEERFAKLEERQQKLEERQQELEERLEKLEERLAQLEERLVKVEEVLSKVVNELTRLVKEFEEYRRKQDLMAVELGALAESMYSRFAWEDIRDEVLASGDKVIMRRRNARVNGEDIDLLIVTERRVYVVEVKLRPKHSDVGELIAKADVVSKVYSGKEVVKVLAGALIGKEIEEYALSKGVQVLTY